MEHEHEKTAEGNGDQGIYHGPRATVPEIPDDHSDDPGYHTRTKFLTIVAVAMGGVMTAAILVPVIGFAVADSLEEEQWRWVDVGAFRDFKKDSTTSLAVTGPDPEADRRVFIRNRDGELLAIWNRCAHLGCPVAYSPGGDVYACPCHGGAYDSLGLVTAGPPPRPLDRFDVKITTAGGEDVARQTTPAEGASTAGASPDDRVLLGRPFSIDEDQNPYKLHGPGELVTGTLSNLYPF